MGHLLMDYVNLSSLHRNTLQNWHYSNRFYWVIQSRRRRLLPPDEGIDMHCNWGGFAIGSETSTVSRGRMEERDFMQREILLVISTSSKSLSHPVNVHGVYTTKVVIVL